MRGDSGRQNDLVVALGGELADRHEVADRLLELVLGQLHLAGEAVQVAHEGRHDLAKAWIGRARDLGEHRRRDVFLAVDDH
jgi:predicted nicotinamide N-methyase